jgi:23S rRNA (cytidine1920-2'-O)/16S rRNA (cytidine1409-2'-O)-methyltransferase
MSSRHARRRLDELCVERGLFEDRAQAARAILAGEVFVLDEPVYARAALVDADAPIRLRSRGRFVSRGGEKLQGAIEAFSLDVAGLSCLDCGASTGGFTDCLLQHGAASVCAVDVGYGQFDWRLRCDDRVQLFERTNINALDPQEAGAPFDLAVADISFAPLRSYLDAVCALLGSDASFVTLVKPQVEVARSDVGRGGIVRDTTLHREVVLRAVAEFDAAGLVPAGLACSPITGAKGNIEFLLLGVRGDAAEGRLPVTSADVAALVSSAHNRLR